MMSYVSAKRKPTQPSPPRPRGPVTLLLLRPTDLVPDGWEARRIAKLLKQVLRGRVEGVGYRCLHVAEVSDAEADRLMDSRQRQADAQGSPPPANSTPAHAESPVAEDSVCFSTGEVSATPEKLTKANVLHASDRSTASQNLRKPDIAIAVPPPSAASEKLRKANVLRRQCSQKFTKFGAFCVDK